MGLPCVIELTGTRLDAAKNRLVVLKGECGTVQPATWFSFERSRILGRHWPIPFASPDGVTYTLGTAVIAEVGDGVGRVPEDCWGTPLAVSEDGSLVHVRFLTGLDSTLRAQRP